MEVEVDFLAQLPGDLRRHAALSSAFDVSSIFKFCLCSKTWKLDSSRHLLQQLCFSNVATEHEFYNPIDSLMYTCQVLPVAKLSQLGSEMLYLLQGVHTVCIWSSSVEYAKSAFSLLKKLRNLQNVFFHFHFPYGWSGATAITSSEPFHDLFTKNGRKLRVVSFTSSAFVDSKPASLYLVDDSNIDCISRCCPNLVALCLPVASAVTAESLKLLAIRCDKLEYLSMPGTPFDYLELKALKSLQRLNIGIELAAFPNGAELRFQIASINCQIVILETAIAGIQSLLPLPLEQVTFADQSFPFAIVRMANPYSPATALEYLIDKKLVDPNSVNRFGTTLLQACMSHDRRHWAKALISRGVAFKSAPESSLFLTALARLPCDLLRVFLQPYLATGDPLPESDLTDSEFPTVLHACVKNMEFVDVLSLVFGPEAIRVFRLDDKALLNTHLQIPGHAGSTSVMSDIFIRRSEIMLIRVLEILLANGMDINLEHLVAGFRRESAVNFNLHKVVDFILERHRQGLFEPPLIRPPLCRPSSNITFAAVSSGMDQLLGYLLQDCSAEEFEATLHGESVLRQPMLAVAVRHSPVFSLMMNMRDGMLARLALKQSKAVCETMKAMVDKTKGANLFEWELDEFVQRLISFGADMAGQGCQMTPLMEALNCGFLTVFCTILESLSPEQAKRNLTLQKGKIKPAVVRLKNLERAGKLDPAICSRIWAVAEPLNIPDFKLEITSAEGGPERVN